MWHVKGGNRPEQFITLVPYVARKGWEPSDPLGAQRQAINYGFKLTLSDSSRQLMFILYMVSSVS